MKTITKRILLLTPFAVGGVYVLAVASMRSEPSGYVASFSIFPHASNDVLNFSQGTVTLQTCCGDSSYGTYSRMPDGRWIWHLRMGTKNPPFAKEILVQSGFLSMSFADTQDPSIKFTLRRRLFEKLPL